MADISEVRVGPSLCGGVSWFSGSTYTDWAKSLTQRGGGCKKGRIWELKPRAHTAGNVLQDTVDGCAPYMYLLIRHRRATAVSLNLTD